MSNIIGKKYNRLLVISKSGKTKKGEYKYKCLCDCGNIVETPTSYNLRKGITKSCGCLQREIAKNKPWHKYKNYKLKSEYNTWSTMKRRCYNKEDNGYKYYGGRGIKVCDRWLESFDDFIEDMGPKPFKGAQLDRIDANKNYEPTNCRWVTPHENILNIVYTDDWGIKVKNNKFSVSVTRDYCTRRLTLSSLELAKQIRDSWVKEYSKNPERWLERTNNKEYKEDINYG